MVLKNGVKVRGLSTELLLGMIVAEKKISQYQDEEVVFTSLCDGTHRRGSLHYTGDAVDIRTHNLPNNYEARSKIAKEISEALGDEYDVIYEYHGSPNAHIHLEFQPKGV